MTKLLCNGELVQTFLDKWAALGWLEDQAHKWALRMENWTSPVSGIACVRLWNEETSIYYTIEDSTERPAQAEPATGRP